jgi:hypothetical protein
MKVLKVRSLLMEVIGTIKPTLLDLQFDLAYRPARISTFISPARRPSSTASFLTISKTLFLGARLGDESTPVLMDTSKDFHKLSLLLLLTYASLTFAHVLIVTVMAGSHVVALNSCGGGGTAR